MGKVQCFHCGDDCANESILFDEKHFCCVGCRTVYEIFQGNDLAQYYDIEAAAGSRPNEVEGKYDFLGIAEIIDKLVEFDDGRIQMLNLFVPQIHCSSCIWVLENLTKLNPSIKSSQVDFPKKTVRIAYNVSNISLKEVVLLLARIGYEPVISLEDYDNKTRRIDRQLVYKLGIAGFAFGNVMFLSFPEYFQEQEFWLERYKHLFRWLMFAFSLPVVFYSAQDYLRSAHAGIRSRTMNIDVPIALGILVLFVRSTVEIIFDWGTGFFDSLTGLVFFLLLGKFFQQKTYAFLSFDRDYKSYFPIAVTRLIENGKEEVVQVYRVGQGDRLLIRNGELIPVDGILVKGNAHIDYSFVTGESDRVDIKPGAKIFAGGKHLGNAVEIKVLKSVSQSHLTQLWGNAIFNENSPSKFQTLTDSIGKRFTVAVLTIASISSMIWVFLDSSMALNVFTAVLIIACPCAIALSAPFALGNLLRILGRRKCYLKDTQTIERIAQLDMVIFDKTGTLSTTKTANATYEGMQLTVDEESLLKNTLRGSSHPLSRKLYDILAGHEILTLDEYQEHLGQGVRGAINGRSIKIGSASFVGGVDEMTPSHTAVYVSSNDDYKGRFVFGNQYRPETSALFEALGSSMKLGVLSGDNEGERTRLEKMLPKNTPLYFNQSPEDKLTFIASMQERGNKVMMVGDGLNDAGALAQSDVGIAISENINVFSPACDGILDASKFGQLHQYIKASKKTMKIVKLSFGLSLLYNLVGLYFAVTGQLEPVVAAILMPLSSISIVVFTTLATNWVGRKLV